MIVERYRLILKEETIFSRQKDFEEIRCVICADVTGKEQLFMNFLKSGKYHIGELIQIKSNNYPVEIELILFKNG